MIYIEEKDILLTIGETLVTSHENFGGFEVIRGDHPVHGTTILIRENGMKGALLWASPAPARDTWRSKRAA